MHKLDVLRKKLMFVQSVDVVCTTALTLFLQCFEQRKKKIDKLI